MMHFHPVPTYRHRIDGTIHSLDDIRPKTTPLEEKSLANRMLENFLTLKSKKIGRLPESGTNSEIDCIAGKIPNTPGVYLLRDGEYFKIGHTSNFAVRISEIRVSNPREIEVSAFIETINRAQAKRLERALHTFFALKRVRGEWFELNSEDLEFFKEYQKSTGQHEIEFLDVETFTRTKKEMAVKSLIRASKTLGKRTMTVQEAMQNSLSLGLTFEGWKDVLHALDREKVIYFSGNLIRIPKDLI